MRISDWSADVGSTDLVYQCAGQPLAFERTDKRSLRCASATGPVELIYRVYAFDESVRKAWLDSRRGFFNGSSLFYCPSGCEHAAFDVELLAPEDELAARRSEEHTSELQSLMRISYAVFCLTKKTCYRPQ